MIALYTDRLKIRTLIKEDWDSFNRLHQNPDVIQYICEPMTELAIKQKFNSRLAPWEFDLGEWLTLVIEDIHTGAFIGFTGFHCDDALLRRAEVGYIIAPEMSGQGYATESLNAVIDWGIHQFGVHKYIGICSTNNLASAKVMTACGFINEGCLRQNYKIGPDWHDEFTFGLLTQDTR
ncbi:MULTISPECIES: GNAT family N-acetyltransferase [unclassified Shewanella]|uniref:GNAT family N-acetyltransferase n=1 Tax=unclassified Shewanella TaxID=196818 RepID=UPI000C81D8BD|nr:MULTISPECIES: GNAT family N-acetyltransferase [unclassified Shewanella]MDO6617813.1 GNAT family N-acetyltransferase [Shewanella sp. 6_MG-2023]MDO6639307.1 GNAT family N-acetyltransferase [Shewanella sp. 5_MG-2023]PMG29463.1 GNAT family N-acetyltransferase [Shewanella sp. 10N.286.52.C2]PMG41329.1 GNAT family N-acetyltransferase [Shewanella sp. 10N.286.52.B9]